jgi:hypothetical protein
MLLSLSFVNFALSQSQRLLVPMHLLKVVFYLRVILLDTSKLQPIPFDFSLQDICLHLFLLNQLLIMDSLHQLKLIRVLLSPECFSRCIQLNLANLLKPARAL